MSGLPRTILICLMLAFLPGTVLAGLIAGLNLQIQPETYTYQLAAGPIIAHSELVYADSLQLLPNLDYRIDYRLGRLTFINLPQTPLVRVEFILVPPDLTQPLYRYRAQAPSDSLFSSIVRKRPAWLQEDGKLSISGSKTFAVTFSDNDAFDLKQTLYVNLDGELSRNVNIAAQLSDSQSKLTPEGDSKELSSLDKVFIRVYGKQYEIAMGDLEWKFSGTRYANYQANIEGLNAWYRGRHFAQAGYTAASGKPGFVRLAIIDGKQGPYYLNPTGFQTTHLIIAGSEEIYQDGRLLERGQDYFIDYSEGSVMFRALVVSSNAVNAWFSYADEYYKQSTYFNSSRIQLLPNLALSHHFIHQADSKDAPLLYDHTPGELEVLRSVGDSLAWADGVTPVDPGEGNYRRRQSPEGWVYYEYAEADTSASYNLVFSYVGTGFGDYEEFSAGKFRWVGPGQGAWLPLKRLVPAVRRSNADLRLEWNLGGLELGAEGVFTANDRNTFSAKDDGDNLSGIIGAFGQFALGESARATTLKLDYEKRWADSYLFTQYEDLREEYDLAGLASADSLAQSRLSLTLSTRRWQGWDPQATFRLRNIPGLYSQKALRLISRSLGQGWLPSLNLRSTLARQDYPDALSPTSLLQYHEVDTRWEFRSLKAGFAGLYNALEYSEPSPLHFGNRYYKLNPQLSFGNPQKFATQLSYAADRNWLNPGSWEDRGGSRTYALKHNLNTPGHTLSLDLTHRELDASGETGQSGYDLISLRNSHNFLKQAVLLMGSYQLNQTEFFPKIQELEYVGNGLGLYDSTGVYTPNGDFDFTYITSDQGSLSSEINAQLSLYLKPGNVDPAWQKLRADLIVMATEQASELDGWRSYVFYPGYVFNSNSTIYGKQNVSPTLWLDLKPGKLTASLGLELDRSLDNRYQSQARNDRAARIAELDLKQWLGNNFNARYENVSESDSRYQSELDQQNLLLLIQRNLSTHTILTLDLEGFSEQGDKQDGGQSYSLRGLAVTPGYKGTWGRKGRASASFGMRFNDRQGSDYLAFLPAKRDGSSFTWAASVTWRLNDFSTFSLEYKGSSYPGEDADQSLKAEFKAEL